MYILTLLSRGPQSGYSIIQRIDERTDGAWKPGAGTMYPLLKALLKEGLVKVNPSKGGGDTKSYSLTPKGGRDLDEARRLIAGAGRKEQVMGRLFSDLLPGSVFVPMIVRRFRDGADVLRQKVSEVPFEEREPLLRELRLALESQIDWVDSELSSPSSVRTKRKRRL